MHSIDIITAFFGWSIVINFILLMITTVALVFLREPITQIHTRIFQVSEADLSRVYFHFLAYYKLAIIIFNLVPYIALKITA